MSSLHNHSHPDHEHSHEHPEDVGIKEILALLNYMSAHNYSHAKELQDMAERLCAAGMQKSADKVIQAAEYLLDAGTELDDAVKLIDSSEGN